MTRGWHLFRRTALVEMDARRRRGQNATLARARVGWKIVVRA